MAVAVQIPPIKLVVVVVDYREYKVYTIQVMSKDTGGEQLNQLAELVDSIQVTMLEAQEHWVLGEMVDLIPEGEAEAEAITVGAEDPGLEAAEVQDTSVEYSKDKQ